MAGATTQAERQAQVLNAGYNGPLTDAAINQAYANAATPSDLSSSGISNKPQGVSSPQTVNPAATTQTTQANQSQLEKLGQQVNSLVGAIASGNKQAFDEAVRQFNLEFGLDKDKFTESVSQFNRNFGIAESGVTGQYQGAQTQQAQLQQANIAAQAAGLTGMFQGTPTMQLQAQQFGQGLSAATLASQLQANPFRQQQAIGQMGRLLGGQGVARFSAPNTVAGVGAAGGNTQGGLGYLSQMIDDIKDPNANQHSMDQVMQGIPTPAKLNSVEFFKAAPSTQNMVLQGMQEKYGLDPGDALAQIKNTLPGFQAPQTFGTVRRPTF